MSRRCASCRWSLFAAVRRGGRVAAGDARGRPRSARSWTASRCPPSRLPPALAGQAGPGLGRSRDRRAAAGQHLRQLVRAVHRRGAGADRTRSARGVPIDGIAIRDRPEDVAAFLARNGDPYDAHRRRHATAASRSRWARRACRKASSSMAAASSATSISARSCRAMCRRSSPSWRRRNEALVHCRVALLAAPRRRWPTAILAAGR